MKRVASSVAVLLIAGCSVDSTAPLNKGPVPIATISDAVHSAGTKGFYFLPPTVGAPPEVSSVGELSLTRSFHE